MNHPKSIFWLSAHRISFKPATMTKSGKTKTPTSTVGFKKGIAKL